MSKILITGATGNIGREILKQFVEKKIDVRAAIHSEVQLDYLKKQAIEVVSIDNNNPGSLHAALNGIEKVFSLTPLVPNLVEQGVNFVEAAKQAGVKYIVRSSGMGAESPDAITLGRWHREVEKAIENSGISYTLLRPNSFMQNYINYASATVKSQNAFYLPQGTGKISLIDVRDIATVVVELLTKNGHEGKAYDLTGPTAISNSEIAEVLSKVTGRTINYVDVPESAARESMEEMGMPLPVVNSLLELSAIIKAGYTATVSSAVEQITGKKGISFEQFANDNVETFK